MGIVRLATPNVGQDLQEGDTRQYYLFQAGQSNYFSHSVQAGVKIGF